MKAVVKTLRHVGQDAPEKVEIETPFSVGRRINVVYDLPQKERRVGYASVAELSHGKALGVFEVTDIYRNMLVNPNFTMVELTSRDKEFDKFHPRNTTMLIDEDVVLQRLKTIDEKMVVAGLKAGIIQLIDSPHDDGAVCSIGDNWFYFGGSEAEGVSAEEYRRNVPEEDIVNEIVCVLNEFEGDPGFNDEYLYYYAHLTEQLKELEAGISVDELIDEASERSETQDNVGQSKDDDLELN